MGIDARLLYYWILIVLIMFFLIQLAKFDTLIKNDFEGSEEKEEISVNELDSSDGELATVKAFL